MSMKLDSSILFFILTVLILFLLVRLLKARSLTVFKIIFQIALGAVFLLIFNYFGKQYNVTIPLNPLTSFLAGVLQLPGVGLLLLVKYIVYA